MDRYVVDTLQKERLRGYMSRNCAGSYCKPLDYFRKRKPNEETCR